MMRTWFNWKSYYNYMCSDSANKRPPLNTQQQIEKLENEIGLYRTMAWTLVCLGIGAFIFGFLSFAWAIFPCADAAGYDRPFLTKLSEIGSFFQGAVGALWALAGFMFIYVAFIGQKLQLVKQDEALEKQQINFTLQQKSILLQQFENSFFQLLNLQKEIASSVHEKMDYSAHASGGGIHMEHEVGRHLFQRWYFILRGFFENESNQSSLIRLLYPAQAPERTLEVKRGFVKDIYANQFYPDYQGELGHYFRNLYHVFKFVDTCELLKDKDDDGKDGDSKKTIKNKRRYTSLVRAQLSQYELALLFYNGISYNGEEKFKPLIEKYGLLENFNEGDLTDIEHMSFYKKTAFENLDC